MNVTITGADNHALWDDLSRISESYPVEWGILCSRTKEGSPRFPSREWVHEAPGNCAAHLCGRYVADLFRGGTLWESDYASLLGKFARVQVNHAGIHISWDDFLKLRERIVSRPSTRWIVPENATNPSLGSVLAASSGCEILVDHSGGRGILGSWPEFDIRPPDGARIGMAGGLTPENVREQIRIASDHHPISWVDVESGVRTGDRLDLDKVRRFVDAALS